MLSLMTEAPSPFPDTNPDFGANSWLVEEMFEQFRLDPASVGEPWQEFFSDYKSMTASVVQSVQTASVPVAALPSAVVATSAQAVVATPAPAGAGVATVPAEDLSEPIRGAGLAIVANMERSLSVPTATSFRNVPAKLLEVNRSVINGYRNRTGQSKVSFTHLIAFAIVRAIADAVPVMSSGFVEGSDGKPRVLHHKHINLGLAVDVAKSDGSRTLVVPVLREVNAMSFSEFVVAYEDMVRKVKQNKLAVADFQGATILSLIHI